MKSVELKSIRYQYFDDTPVFDGHSLFLGIPDDQDNGLYGIIGLSGTGKTTLLSILGGQFRPDSGEVLVDGVNIYQVGDLKRRELIGIQMQTSTSLRGKLRYNLLFGLPDDVKKSYLDEELVRILTRVGLWHLFQDKKGLDTMIGEGGVNLSGGQRQRLNFAGLYIRARYFEPSLLLIDEPTSSLDELSEAAITAMIRELAEDSLTLVVAHRLKTLDEAQGILDTSLLKTQKDLEFMDRKTLEKKSKYYQDLMSGSALLDG